MPSPLYLALVRCVFLLWSTCLIGSVTWIAMGLRGVTPGLSGLVGRARPGFHTHLLLMTILLILGSTILIVLARSFARPIVTMSKATPKIALVLASTPLIASLCTALFITVPILADMTVGVIEIMRYGMWSIPSERTWQGVLEVFKLNWAVSFLSLNCVVFLSQLFLLKMVSISRYIKMHTMICFPGSLLLALITLLALLVDIVSVHLPDGYWTWPAYRGSLLAAVTALIYTGAILQASAMEIRSMNKREATKGCRKRDITDS